MIIKPLDDLYVFVSILIVYIVSAAYLVVLDLRILRGQNRRIDDVLGSRSLRIIKHLSVVLLVALSALLLALSLLSWASLHLFGWASIFIAILTLFLVLPMEHSLNEGFRFFRKWWKNYLEKRKSLNR